MTRKILVVDDEKDILDLLGYNLRKVGFEVSTAMTGKDALQMIRGGRVDLVLLDWMLPDLSGTEVLAMVRADATRRHIPIILLTARGEEIDKLVGFELGADDYITKPFNIRELILRVRAVFRREPDPGTETAGPPNGESLHLGPIEIDVPAHMVRLEGEAVPLTVTEFNLLLDLVKSRGRVRTREALLTEVWGYDTEVTSRTIDTHMRRLREKLGEAADLIETVRGVGYRVRVLRAE